MSSVLYNRQWKRACTELENIKINYEPAAEDPPIIDRKEALQKLINLFIRYSKVKYTVRCVFPMAISPDFRMGQYRDDGFRAGAPRLIFLRIRTLIYF